MSEIEFEQRHYDTMFNAVNCFQTLSDTQKADFVETLFSLCQQKLDNLSENSSVKQRNDMKVCHYFLHVLCMKAERLNREIGSVVESGDGEGKATGKTKKTKQSKQSSVFEWMHSRAPALSLFLRTLKAEPSHFWFMGIAEEAFLTGMWKFALELQELRPSGVAGIGSAETAVRNLCTDVMVLSAQQLSSCSATGDELTTLVTSMIDSVCRVEHMGVVVAEVCRRENGRFAASAMGEVGSMNLTELGKSAVGVKNIGSFLATLSEVAPKLMAVYLPSFIHLLDSEIYQIRSV